MCGAAMRTRCVCVCDVCVLFMCLGFLIRYAERCGKVCVCVCKCTNVWVCAHICVNGSDKLNHLLLLLLLLLPHH